MNHFPNLSSAICTNGYHAMIFLITRHFPERMRALHARALRAPGSITGLLLVATLLTLPVTGQDTGNRPGWESAGRPVDADSARTLLDTWLRGQRAGLQAVDAFSITADVRHRVETHDGQREARYGILYRRPDEEDRGRGDLQYFVLDGDTLDVAERRRVERTISSMMTEEMGPLLNGLNLPSFLIARARPAGEAMRIERDGRVLIRIPLLIEGPQNRVRQGAPGGRPGFRPPGGARRPPGGMRPPPAGLREGPPPRMLVFLDAVTGELVMTRVRIDLPGDRGLMAETRFQRIQGLDIPLRRTVSGTFPQQRRLRTVTVALDHETRFTDVALNLGN